MHMPQKTLIVIVLLSFWSKAYYSVCIKSIFHSIRNFISIVRGIVVYLV